MKEKKSNKTGKGSAPSRLEPWPYYYRFRGTELSLLKRAIPNLPGGWWLDVGCGIGFMTATLAETADKIAGIDLPFRDPTTHSPGLDPAVELSRYLGADNVYFSAGSAVHLPFADESIDVVFSAYTLEHVPQRELAVKEMARVLKRGGIFILLLPGAFERVTFIPAYYLGIVGELWKWSVAKLRGSRNKPNEFKSGNPVNPTEDVKPSNHGRTILGRFLQRHPTFPGIEPHGEYANSFEEFRSHRRNSWKSLLLRYGLTTEDEYVSFFLPTQLVDRFSERLRAFLYEMEAQHLPLSIRRSRLMLPFGQGILYHGRKR